MSICNRLELIDLTGQSLHIRAKTDNPMPVLDCQFVQPLLLETRMHLDLVGEKRMVQLVDGRPRGYFPFRSQ